MAISDWFALGIGAPILYVAVVLFDRFTKDRGPK